jgi:hypothetical protein
LMFGQPYAGASLRCYKNWAQRTIRGLLGEPPLPLLWCRCRCALGTAVKKSWVLALLILRWCKSVLQGLQASAQPPPGCHATSTLQTVKPQGRKYGRAAREKRAQDGNAWIQRHRDVLLRYGSCSGGCVVGAQATNGSQGQAHPNVTRRPPILLEACCGCSGGGPRMHVQASTPRSAQSRLRRDTAPTPKRLLKSYGRRSLQTSDRYVDVGQR